MTAIEAFLGWLVIAVVFYVPSAAFVAAVMSAVHAIRPGLTPSKTVMRTLNVAVAVGLWVCIPIIVHARFGRADH